MTSSSFKSGGETSRIQSLVVNLALLLGSLTVFFLVAEIATRMLMPPAESRGKFTQPTEAPYGYELIPDASAVVVGEPVNVNRLGFRDRERQLAKPAGTRRIVVIGDSHAFGTGVADEEIFTRLLEQNLTATGDAVEVLNLGVGGYNTTQEVHLLEHRGLAFEPDLVLVLYTLSDVMEPMVATPPFHPGSTAPSTAGGKPAPSPGAIAGEPKPEAVSSHELRFGVLGRFRKMIRRSVLARLIFYRLSTLSLIGKTGGNWDNLYTPEYQGWLEARAALSHAAALARDRGLRLVLAIHPELVSLENYPHTGAHRALAAFAESEGIAVFDLLTVYGGHDATALWIRPDDRHPNAQGHRLIADGLAAFLLENPELWLQSAAG